MSRQRYLICTALSLALHGVAFSAIPSHSPLSFKQDVEQRSVHIQLGSALPSQKEPLREKESPEKTTTQSVQKAPEPKKIQPIKTKSFNKKTSPKKIIPIKEDAKKTLDKTKTLKKSDAPVELAQRKSAPVQQEKPVFKVPPSPPKYPRMARRKGMEGMVIVEVWLDKHGNQTKRILIKSAGFTLLDNAAIDAIKKWHFSGYKENDISLAHRVRIPVHFNLD